MTALELNAELYRAMGEIPIYKHMSCLFSCFVGSLTRSRLVLICKGKKIIRDFQIFG